MYIASVVDIDTGNTYFTKNLQTKEELYRFTMEWIDKETTVKYRRVACRCTGYRGSAIDCPIHARNEESREEFYRHDMSSPQGL